MSRSGYNDDCDNIWLYRRAVENALAGRRGQDFLRELAGVLDAMPDKRLGAHSLLTEDGEYCTLGTIGLARGIDMTQLDADDPEHVGKAFKIPRCMAAEIVYMNDEYQLDDHQTVEVEVFGPLQPWHQRRSRMRVVVPDGSARRYRRMRAWVDENLKPPANAGQTTREPA